jgi:hypothetical protein
MLAVALMLMFQPFRSDLEVGNLNSIHLLCAAVPLAIASGPLRRTTRTGSGAAGPWGVVTLSLLAFYVLFKPSFFLLGAAVAAHVAWRLGLRRFARAAVPAAAVAGLLVAWPCLFFGSAAVWTDWLAYVGGGDGMHLAYGIGKFNTSLTLHLADWLGGSPLIYGAGFAAVLLVSFLFLGVGPARRSAGAGPIRAAVATAFGDPLVAASLGIVMTLATSPLVWGHYTMAVLVALAWTMQPAHGLRAHFWLIALATVLYARGFLLGLEGIELLFKLGWTLSTDTVNWLVAVAWIPLWIGLLLLLRRTGPDAEPRAAAGGAIPSSVSPA